MLLFAWAFIAISWLLLILEAAMFANTNEKLIKIAKIGFITGLSIGSIAIAMCVILVIGRIF